MLPKLIVIVGPTASGKTGLAIEIAKRFDGEVISVDSRQVYREMDIGTAKGGKRSESESTKERSAAGSIRELFGDRPMVIDGVSHWGIDLIDPDQEYSVADFKAYAEKKIKEILKRNLVPILVGGTGLWMAAFIDNFDLTQTAADPKVRLELESRPLGDLFAQYKRLDPDGSEVIDRENKRRVVRALEVCLLTGQPFSKQQTKGEAKYEVLQIGRHVDREELFARINDRVDKMIAAGLVSEVRGLKEKYGCQIDAMTGIGYRQICTFLDGVVPLAQAIEEIKKATRQYAKRQLTWFKRDARIHWVMDDSQAITLVSDFL
ncbi:tRNA (adenosine(37)-N6)-dimethylallyltransferase MiaA [Candidatus Uhrbacteria bacterium]|nr:tRNA (adenosine(37)-N6)-dimethylallyltransferase MiaA [Candidatus Uhrbacteria bacterium]